MENFERLGLKRLIATCYKSQDVDLFSQGECERAICQIYEGDKNGNMALEDDEVYVRHLEGDGDFRSAELAADEIRDARLWYNNGRKR